MANFLNHAGLVLVQMLFPSFRMLIGNEPYKIICKLLVLRPKQVLHKCIGWEQSAFIKARQIINNIALAMECLKFLCVVLPPQASGK